MLPSNKHSEYKRTNTNNIKLKSGYLTQFIALNNLIFKENAMR